MSAGAAPPASRPGRGGGALLQSPGAWAGRARVWLRDSRGGGGPGSPRREGTLAVSPPRLSHQRAL